MAKNGSTKNDSGKSTESKRDTDHRGDNATSEPRDSEGRFAKVRGLKMPEMKMPKMPDVKMPEASGRNIAIGAGVVAAVVAGAALFRGWNARSPSDSVGPVDLDAAEDTADVESLDMFATADAPSDAAATGSFIDDDKRDAFAPALKPVPSRIEAMGNGDDA